MRTLRILVKGFLALSLMAGIAGGTWFTRGDHRVYAVRTGSMSSTFLPGDAVIDAPVSAELRVGDVITFRSQGVDGTGLTTHRIHGFKGSDIQTKGDANRTPDIALVPRANVVGRVIAGVPKGGYVLYFFSQWTGVAALMTALLALSMLWGLFFPASEDTEVTSPVCLNVRMA